ncbi:hypothetical protein RVBP18_3530 [Pseudomonas phage sp. LC]|nr:hypothetical protein RVBP18_3530 [Pseudomonas phage sp. LC]
MNPLLLPLPFDETGESYSNRTKGEYHSLAKQKGFPYRIIVMDKGYFYTKGMVIRDGRQNELNPEMDYQCTGINPEVIEKTGLEACSVIVITKQDVHEDIYIDAQMCGGIYCNLAPSISEHANALLNNTRKPHWSNILDIPDQFKPNGHMHAYWELYGFTPRVVKLKEITDLLKKSSSDAYDSILDEFKYQLSLIEADLNTIEARLTTHISDTTTNPHQTRKGQVALGNVYNAGIATETQAKQPNGAIMNVYATPWSMKLSVDTNYTVQYLAHVNDITTNPHRVTAEQLNTYTVTQANILLNQKLDKGKTANTSKLLFGQDVYSMGETVRAKMPLSVLTTGRLAPGRIGNSATWPGRDWTLMPNGQWTHFGFIFNRFQKTGTMVHWNNTNFKSIQEAIAFHNTYFSDPEQWWPGSLAICHYEQEFVIGHGNGTTATSYRNTLFLRKVGSTWTNIGEPA